MSAPDAFVYIELDGELRLVGQLWVSATRTSQRASFEYDKDWLAKPLQYALGPALPSGPGMFFTAEGRNMFGAVGDSAPDRWGRKLITRAEIHRAREKGTKPRTLTEIDYLLGVSDITRQGALRFARSLGGPFVGEGNTVPPLVELGKLLSAAEEISEDADTNAVDEAVRILLAPGSSLGGARAKASIRDVDGTLSIAKFPEPGDEVEVTKWESVMLGLAHRSGIAVPISRLEHIGDRVVLIEKRFDRMGNTRVPFLSAMSLLNAKDGEPRSYVELADAVRQISLCPAQDLSQLWRRMAFSILASNFDDHLRNHAVVFVDGGWTLSPAYDLNPTPLHIKPRVLTTAVNVDGDTTASIELAIDAAPEFMMSESDARAAAREVAKAVSTWREQAAKTGISDREIERMSSAFQTTDMDIALLGR